MEPQTVNDLQKQVDKLRNSHNKVIILAIIVVLLIILIFAIAVSKKGMTPADYAVKALTDSMNARDKRRLLENKQLQHTVDSLTGQYTGIRQQVTGVSTALTNINHRYDQQRHIITTGTDDEQLSILSEWLSQTDSL
jgi:hypothetical protein